MKIKGGKNEEYRGSSGGPNSRKEVRMNRTLRANEYGGDTSIAEDSEAMDVDRLSVHEWPPLDQTFKKPRNPDINTSTIVGEIVADYKEIRDKIKKYGTIATDVNKDHVNKDHANEDTPQPQRPPRNTQSRAIRSDIKVLGNVQIRKPTATMAGKEVTRSEATRKEVTRKETTREEMTRKETTRNVQPGYREDSSSAQEWITKKNRREIRKNKEAVKNKDQRETAKKTSKPATSGKTKVTRRPPRSSAVTLKISKDKKDKYTYASILAKAREKISLDDLGIDKTRIRRTAGDNILIAIPGLNKQAEADKLAAELTKVLGEDIMVSRPNIMGELRLYGLDDSITVEEIKEVISKHGNCKIQEIRSSNIKGMRNGLGMIWIKCPLSSAIQISKFEKIRIGWSTIKVEMLSAREKQCFRCWRYGHLKYNCKVDIDRTGHCYRCGSPEHKVKECTYEAQCLVCKENKVEWHHRMGSMACVKNRKNIKNPPIERGTPSLVSTVKVPQSRTKTDDYKLTRTNDHKATKTKDMIDDRMEICTNANDE